MSHWRDFRIPGGVAEAAYREKTEELAVPLGATELRGSIYRAEFEFVATRHCCGIMNRRSI